MHNFGTGRQSQHQYPGQLPQPAQRPQPTDPAQRVTFNYTTSSHVRPLFPQQSRFETPRKQD